MKIAVTGSRTFTDFDLLEKTLQKYDIDILISGGAIGADELAEKYAKKNNITTSIHYPDYIRYGKSAPFIRNALIVKEADLVIAFWNGTSQGTLHTIKLAHTQNKLEKIINFKEKKTMDKETRIRPQHDSLASELAILRGHQKADEEKEKKDKTIEEKIGSGDIEEMSKKEIFKKHSLTIYEIKERTRKTSPYFFTTATLKFFGQTMKDFNVTKRGNTYRLTAPIRMDGELIGHTIRYFDPCTNQLSLPKTKEIEGKSLLDDKRDNVSMSLNTTSKPKHEEKNYISTLDDPIKSTKEKNQAISARRKETDPIDRCQNCGSGYNDKDDKQEHLCPRCKDEGKHKLPTNQYNFYRDPSHAWLAVTRQELIDLHIDRIISKHSYQKGNLVYLEEDGDANLFLKAAIKQAQFNVELIDKQSDKPSIIRTYKPYSPDEPICQFCGKESFCSSTDLSPTCPACFIKQEVKRVEQLKKDTAPTEDMKNKIQHNKEREQADVIYFQLTDHWTDEEIKQIIDHLSKLLDANKRSKS